MARNEMGAICLTRRFHRIRSRPRVQSAQRSVERTAHLHSRSVLSPALQTRDSLASSGPPEPESVYDPSIRLICNLRIQRESTSHCDYHNPRKRNEVPTPTVAEARIRGSQQNYLRYETLSFLLRRAPGKGCKNIHAFQIGNRCSDWQRWRQRRWMQQQQRELYPFGRVNTENL